MNSMQQQSHGATPALTPGPTPEEALSWLARWEAQQAGYVPGREDRFAVIIAAVEAVAGAAPLVLDLGCGPGSLGIRLRTVLPAARVVGVDADPVLLAIGRAAHPELTFVDADLSDPDWVTATGLTPGVVDAVVSTTALHWLDPATLTEVVAACAALLRPGGVWLDGDHLGLSGHNPGLAAVITCLRETDHTATTSGELWEQWWEAVLSDPVLAAAALERDRRHPGGHSHSQRPQPRHDDYTRALTAAGFAEIAELWRRADDVVLAALR